MNKKRECLNTLLYIQFIKNSTSVSSLVPYAPLRIDVDSLESPMSHGSLSFGRLFPNRVVLQDCDHL